MKKFWLLASVLAIFVVGCGGDPAPVVGDAPITKDMPAKQEAPPSAASREAAQPKPPTALPLDK